MNWNKTFMELIDKLVKAEVELYKLNIIIKNKDDEIAIYKQQIKEYENYDMK
jgi:hypothetical protein